MEKTVAEERSRRNLCVIVNEKDVCTKEVRRIAAIDILRGGIPDVATVRQFGAVGHINNIPSLIL